MDLDLGDTRLILAECAKYGCTVAQSAYIMATARWETNHTVKPVREAYWLSEDWRRDNLRYYPWYGRGYVQLTWETNYIRAGRELGRDLTTDPDAVMESRVSAAILVTGSMRGWFTGKSIPDYINATQANYVNARRVINGTDKARAIADLAIRYEAALIAAGYGDTRHAILKRPRGSAALPVAGIVAGGAVAVASFWNDIICGLPMWLADVLNLTCGG
jgi:putative chitinase